MEPWWRGSTIYHIYPRSFCDSNDDGVGDLPGITSRLDYVASLGVDGIWLSPFFKSPMHDFGYDVADYCDVDPLFGTLADFDALLDKAHRLGLKVIIDQVLSHTSDQHAWFQESRSSRDNPKADWYVWADPKPDGSPPNNWQSVFSGASWTWDARRGQYYFHNFLTQQPDLNLHQPAVQDALLACCRFWLDRGVDGFRLDAINFGMHDPQLRDNPPRGIDPRDATRPFDFQRHVNSMSHPDIPKFLERLRALTDEYDGIFTVAEVGGIDPLPEMKSFTKGTNRLNTAYSFDFLYAPSLSTRTVQEAFEPWNEGAGDGWPSWAFSNHDAPRAVSRWVEGPVKPAHAQLYLALLMSLKGNIFLYQGEELGLPQADVPRDALVDPEAIANWPRTLGRDGARTPMPWVAESAGAGFSAAKPWLPMDRRHVDLAVDRQEADPEATLHVARRLLALRRENKTIKTGALRFRDVSDTVLAFERAEQQDRLLCLFNLTDASQPHALEDAHQWRVKLALGIADHANRIPDTLPAHSALIAEQA